MNKFLPSYCPDCCLPLIEQKDGKYKLIDSCPVRGCNELLERDRRDYEERLKQVNNE